ncbi:MAG: CPBP family intramembrane metalloprotease [Clostridia bacterium]|nr:CPBP family intramembrane metalloprotease [Clostridia bacterium]
MSFNDANEIIVVDDMPDEIKREKKYVSGLFFRIVISSVAAYISIILIVKLIHSFFPKVYDNSFASLLVNDLYTVCTILVFSLLSRRLIPQKTVVMDKMTFKSFVSLVIISFFLMITGSIVGNVVSAYVGKIINIEMVNVVDEIVSEFPAWQIFIAVVIIAPITEEYLFRKLIITRVTKYGTTFAVLFSGILFGTFHGNFYQFFYASAIGILLSYVYCIYGKLRFCILIHSIMNFFGSIVPLYISNNALESGTITSIITYAYSLLMMLSPPLGIFLLISYFKRFRFFTVSGVLIHPEKTLLKNIGFIIYIVVTLIFFALSIFA